MPTIINGSSPSITFSDATTQSSAGLTSSSTLNAANITTGTLGVANGGTGQTTYTNGQLLIGNTTGNTLTKATLTAGSGISITNGTGSISIAATGGGTVTSVATGNGLSGGTITSTGTLVVACPTFNTVGSYCFAVYAYNSSQVVTAGSDYAAGTGPTQIQAVTIDTGGGADYSALSGTWKWMGATKSGAHSMAVACRVS
jgi:hypothetical protein